MNQKSSQSIEKLNSQNTLFIILFIFFGIMFTLFTGKLIKGLVQNKYCKQVLTHWPTTNGKIKKARVKGTRVLIFHCEYTYSLANKAYYNDKFSYAFHKLNIQESEYLSKKYTINSEIKVYYNPENHQESYINIKPGNKLAIEQGMINAPILGMILLTLILLYYRNKSFIKHINHDP